MPRSAAGAGVGAPRPSWVVVPARDEAADIQACIAALGIAAGQVPGPVHVVVVDDGSADATAALAGDALATWGFGHAVLAGRGEGVGWARRVGLEYALDASGRLDRSDPDAGSAPVTGSTPDALIATTDADSQVAPDWFVAIQRRLDEGHPVVAGDILLHSTTDPRLVAARAERLAHRLAALPPDEAHHPHPHFAGGSLAFTASVLRRLGPLPTPRALEDQAILDRCRALGIPVLRDAGVQVITSARTVGRAPRGLADALALDIARLTPN